MEAEHDARERLASLKRDEREKSDLHAKLEVVTKRLEQREKRNEEDHSKMQELQEQDRMYQQALPSPSISLLTRTRTGTQI